MQSSRIPAVAIFAVLIAASVPNAPARAPEDKPSATEAWWADLEKDEPQASRALLKLAATPGETTAFLKDKLPPLKIDADRVRFLLSMLGDEKEEVWKLAFEEMEYFDPRLAIDLEFLMPMAPASPARQRMVEVLSGRKAGSLAGRSVELRKTQAPDSFNFSSQGGSWWAEARVDRLNSNGWGNPKKKWTRAVRAIALLESFGDPEAVALIKGMAAGHPDAQPTRVAREALERLGVKGE